MSKNIIQNPSELPRPRRRITELMLNVAENRYISLPQFPLWNLVMRCDCRGQEEGGSSGGKEWGLTFLRSPMEIVSSPDTGRLVSLRLEINSLHV